MRRGWALGEDKIKKSAWRAGKGSLARFYIHLIRYAFLDSSPVPSEVSEKAAIAYLDISEKTLDLFE